jgi:hypothetical protein
MQTMPAAGENAWYQTPELGVEGSKPSRCAIGFWPTRSKERHGTATAMRLHLARYRRSLGSRYCMNLTTRDRAPVRVFAGRQFR